MADYMVPNDGLEEAWDRWNGREAGNINWSMPEMFDTRIPAHAAFLRYALAKECGADPGSGVEMVLNSEIGSVRVWGLTAGHAIVLFIDPEQGQLAKAMLARRMDAFSVPGLAKAPDRPAALAMICRVRLGEIHPST